MPTLRSLLAAASATVALLLFAAPPAAAHATLTGTSPEDGAVVDTQPERVTLSFSERVSIADDGIRVLDPAGEPAHTGTPTDLSDGDGTRHGIALRPDLPEGTYVVAWQAVSADSHPIGGAFTFSVGAPSDTSVDVDDAAAATHGDDGAVGVLYDVTRYAAYAGFVLLAGSAAFVLRCWPRAAGLRTAHRVLLTGWTTLTAATLAQLLLRTPYTGSGRLADAFDLDGLHDVVGTRTGTYLLSRLLLLAAAGLFVAFLTGSYARLAADAGRATGRDDRRRRRLHLGLGAGGAVLAVATAVTWALAEHAATGPQTALAVPADTLHLLAAAAWLGGLVTLLALLHREPTTLPRAAVRRFSQLALVAVATLAVTGLYQSWRQVRTLDGLVDTEFGRLLLVKVALVAAMLAVAARSRRFTARLAEVRAGGGAADAADADRHDADAEGGGTGETTRQDNGEQDNDGQDNGERDDGAAGGEPADPERARQLARQRAAVARARLARSRNADPARAGLRRSVLAEAAIAAVVLAVTTVLTTTTPARTEAAAPDAPAASGGDHGDPPTTGEPFSGSVSYDTGGEGGQGTAHLTLDPARATGTNTLTIHLSTDAEEVRVAFTLPAEDIGPLRYDEPQRDAGGQWTVTGVQLPRPGEWRLDLTVRTSDIDQVTVSTTVPVS